MLIDTQGVPDVPVRGYGSTSRTNAWGKAIIGDVNSYYRNKASIDVNQLGDNAEATKSVVQATLTEGAIGYRQFDVIAGAKAMAVIKLADGSEPPFWRDGDECPQTGDRPGQRRRQRLPERH
ncbi:Outer membrane usher protein papC precursor [Serratia fonticola]|uniref:Outer membrane usher protein papC n=1 Tax=Serratia fonticola TaxID=47917 RepID=A0A4U9TNQ8_SERFO|nr:Outer membrane usher protein papC precursor [Serratia fonticola]